LIECLFVTASLADRPLGAPNGTFEVYAASEDVTRQLDW